MRRPASPHSVMMVPMTSSSLTSSALANSRRGFLLSTSSTPHSSVHRHSGAYRGSSDAPSVRRVGGVEAEVHWVQARSLLGLEISNERRQHMHQTTVQWAGLNHLAL